MSVTADRQTLSHPLAHPRWPALALLLASGGALAAALAFQYLGGLGPCVLCLWQRWPYGVALVLAALALALAKRARVRALLLGLAGSNFLIGAGIALYHTGVERHWWAGTPGCGVPTPAGSLEALRAQILAAPVVRCDEIPWSLFGLSMANYNVILSLALAAVALIAARRALFSGRPA